MHSALVGPLTTALLYAHKKSGSCSAPTSVTRLTCGLYFHLRTTAPPRHSHSGGASSVALQPMRRPGKANSQQSGLKKICSSKLRGLLSKRNLAKLFKPWHSARFPVARPQHQHINDSAYKLHSIFHMLTNSFASGLSRYSPNEMVKDVGCGCPSLPHSDIHCTEGNIQFTEDKLRDNTQTYSQCEENFLNGIHYSACLRPLSAFLWLFKLHRRVVDQLLTIISELWRASSKTFFGILF